MKTKLSKCRVEAERFAFERWATGQGYILERVGKDYQSAETNDAFFVWIARATLDLDK